MEVMKNQNLSQEAARHGQFTSIFSQLLKIFSRSDFERAVSKHNAQKAAKGFDCWTQFVAMLFCQVGRAHSLREICGGLASVEGKLNHLGVGNAPARSTLSYANAHRPYVLFEEVFGQLLERCRSLAAPKPFRFKNKLYSLDATVIDLCLSAFAPREPSNCIFFSITTVVWPARGKSPMARLTRSEWRAPWSGRRAPSW